MNGILVTGPNGGIVFLPAAGGRWLVDLDGEGSLGFYWSSSLDPIGEIYAFGLGFRSDYWGWYNYYGRSDGLSVRAVCP